MYMAFPCTNTCWHKKGLKFLYTIQKRECMSIWIDIPLAQMGLILIFF